MSLSLRQVIDSSDLKNLHYLTAGIEANALAEPVGGLRCEIGWCGGRRFRAAEVKDKVENSGTICLKDIEKRLQELSKNLSTENPKDQESIKTCAKIYATIQKLDKEADALLEKQCCIYKLLTKICQLFGNCCFNRISRIPFDKMEIHVKFDAIEKGVAEEEVKEGEIKEMPILQKTFDLEEICKKMRAGREASEDILTDFIQSVLKEATIAIGTRNTKHITYTFTNWSRDGGSTLTEEVEQILLAAILAWGQIPEMTVFLEIDRPIQISQQQMTKIARAIGVFSIIPFQFKAKALQNMRLEDLRAIPSVQQMFAEPNEKLHVSEAEQKSLLKEYHEALEERCDRFQRELLREEQRLELLQRNAAQVESIRGMYRDLGKQLHAEQQQQQKKGKGAKAAAAAVAPAVPAAAARAAGQ